MPFLKVAFLPSVKATLTERGGGGNLSDEAGIASAFGARQQEEAFGEEAGRRNGDGGETSPSPHHQRMLCSNCQTIHAEDVPFQLSDIQMSVHPISFAKPLASCQPHQKCPNKTSSQASKLR